MSEKENKSNFTMKLLNELPIPAKNTFYYDAGQPGLRLLVTPTGNKSFQFQMWSKAAGKPLTRTLGKLKSISIPDARKQSADLISELNNGINFEAKKRDQRRERLLDPTVKQFSSEFIEKYAKVNKRTWQEDERILNKDVLPEIGKIRMKDVKKRDIISVLDKIVERGAPIASNRTLAVMSKMFNFALERDVIEVFPLYGIKKSGKEQSRDRILSDPEIKMLWNALGKTPVCMLLRFLLITGQRTGEARQMKWSEIEGKHWTIPGEKTKNGMVHIVPLSDMATEILEQMWYDSPGDYVFPGHFDGKDGAPGQNCLDNKTVPHHFRKLTAEFKWERATAHDLRRTVRSYLSKLGVDKTVAEKVMNHKEQGITGVYDRHEYLDEKVLALEKWSNRLREILTGHKAKIINIPSKGAI